MLHGKISQFLKEHWRGAILVLGVGVFCAAFLYCCQNGADISIKNNKVTITKSKTR